MFCQEKLSIPLQDRHVKNLSKFRDEHVGLFPRSGIGGRSDEILLRVKEYAQRDFTYPSDALDAFQGVCRAFQSLPHPVHQMCGIFILDPMMLSSTKHLSLGEMLAFGLCWGFSGETTRQPHFPSWTCLGWKAGSNAEFAIALQPKNRSAKVLSTVSMELKPGKVEEVDKSSWRIGASGYPELLVLRA